MENKKYKNGYEKYTEWFEIIKQECNPKNLVQDLLFCKTYQLTNGLYAYIVKNDEGQIIVMEITPTIEEAFNEVSIIHVNQSVLLRILQSTTKKKRLRKYACY